MDVRISTELLARIVADAAGSRDEICGLLFGVDGAIMGAEPCRNVAVEPRRRFEIDPAALLRAHRAARSGGPELTGCYHSHPSGRPEPSPRDAVDAAPNGWLWLIVGGGEVRAFRAVPHGLLHGRFDPITIIAAREEGRHGRD